MKRKIFLVMALCTLFVGCSNQKGTISENEVAQVVMQQQVKVTQEPIALGEKKLFTSKDLTLGNMMMMTVNYGEIKEKLGEPIQVKSYRRYQSASEEYVVINIAEYDQFELNFMSLKENEGVILDEQLPISFDIFAKGIEGPAGLYVGMTVEEVSNVFGDYEVGLYKEEEPAVYAVKGMLQQFREANYYEAYDEAIQLTHDFASDLEQNEDLSAMSLVLLIKEGVVEHIILGYPGRG